MKRRVLPLYPQLPRCPYAYAEDNTNAPEFPVLAVPADSVNEPELPLVTELPADNTNAPELPEVSEFPELNVTDPEWAEAPVEMPDCKVNEPEAASVSPDFNENNPLS